LNELFLTAEGNGYSDKMIVQFNEEATAGFDGEFDAWKFKGDEAAPQLYSVYDGNELSVNILPFEGENMIIPVNFEAGADGQYTITADELENFEAATEIWLEDLKNDEMIDLTQTASYSFGASQNDEANRFLLHFNNTAFGTEENSVIDLNIYSYGPKVYLTSQNTIDGNIKVVNMLGKVVYKSGLSNSTYFEIGLDVMPGYYLVGFTNDEKTITKKVMIK